jgi:hypothetical protein
VHLDGAEFQEDWVHNRLLPIKESWRLGMTSYLLSAISCQLSAISHQP